MINLLSHMFEPQNYSLDLEICILLALIVSFTTFALKVTTEVPGSTIGMLLLVGGYGGNVVARAADWIAVTPNISIEVVLASAYACFAGMFATMFVWFVTVLVLPAVTQPRTLVRRNEPKGVVGRMD